MNWQTVLLLAAAFLGISLLHARTIPKRRKIFLIVWLIVAILIYRWANYRGAWREVGIAAASAFLFFIIWWVVYGRRLPTPTDDGIRVWSEEDPF
jgi:hypothetical protein